MEEARELRIETAVEDALIQLSVLDDTELRFGPERSLEAIRNAAEVLERCERDRLAANEREARLREALQQIRQEVGTSTLAWLIATRALGDVPTRASEATKAMGEGQDGH